MKNDGFISLFGCVLCFSLACKTSSSSKTVEAETAKVQLHEDAEQHAQAEKHEVQKTGPAEQYHEDVAPDGGVSGRTWTRWGGSTSESWLKEKQDAEEHIDIDAGVQKLKTGEDEHSMTPALSCVFGGWLWAGVLAAGLLFAFRILRRSP